MNYYSINIEKHYPRSGTTISKIVYSLVEKGAEPQGVCMPKCYANSENIVSRYLYDDCISIAELLPLCNTAVGLVKILKGIKASLYYLNEEYGLSTNNFLFTVDEIFMTSAGDILLLPSIAKLAVPNDVERTVFISMLKLSSVKEYVLERIRLAIESYYSIEGLKLGAFESALDIAAEFEGDEYMEQDEVPLLAIAQELSFDDSEPSDRAYANIPDLPVPAEDPFILNEQNDFSVFGLYGNTPEMPQNDTYSGELYSQFIQNQEPTSWNELNSRADIYEDNITELYGRAVLLDISTQELYPIYSNPFSIGSAPDNSLRLNSPGVSDYHATIFIDSGIYYIQDENSMYHTYIDGEELAQNGAYQLTNGCLLTFADASLVFRLT